MTNDLDQTEPHGGMTSQETYITHNEEAEAAAEAAADYWDTARLGDLTAAAQNAAEAEEYYDHNENVQAVDLGEVDVPALPAVEIPMQGDGKPKAISVHDMKWNKHIEGEIIVASARSLRISFLVFIG